MYRKASMEEEEGSVSCVVVAEQTGSDSSLFHQSWSLGIKLSSFAAPLSIPRQRGDSCKIKKTANTLSAGPIRHPLSSPLG